jgi:aspartate/tyrosine/aromatic aminotransferase
MSPFESMPELPPDPIFGLTATFKADTRQNKYTFITGYFRGENLKTPLLKSVDEVEKGLVAQKYSREYLPILGDQEFIDELGKLIFGKERRERIFGMQTVGGTGALYLAGRLASLWTNQIAISNPTWPNHWGIFSAAGLKTEGYPYYEHKKLQIDWCLEKLETLPAGSCVLLHTSCHNPTGLDFTREQWLQVAELCEKKRLFAILDMAYQGFSKTPEEDAFPARHFLSKGLEFALTYTCAKNFSIYGERGGALYVVADSPKKLDVISSQLSAIARSIYSNPPMHPALLVKTVLKTPHLYQNWLEELEQMRKRMIKIRKDFTAMMVSKDPEGGWEEVGKGHGLFCCSELSPDSIGRLRDEKALYLAADGRINLTGLNQNNLEQFVDALLAVR